MRLRFSSLRSKRRNRGSNSPNRSSRRCLLESLEGRRLLAAGDDIAFVSFIGSGVVGGVRYEDEDILALDQSSGEWSMYFDGSKVGAGGLDLEAMQVLPDGDILISFDGNFNVPGLGIIPDSDILKFSPTGHGINTAGTFTHFFDGSDVEIPSINGDIRALSFTPDGRLVVATVATVTAQGQTNRKEDLLVLNNGVFGEQTSGSWEPYFDGSDIGLGSNYNFGTWIDDDGKLFITTRFAFNLDGASGDPSDVLACDPITLGESTSCNLSLAFDGSANGISPNQTLDTIQFGSFTGNEVFGEQQIYMSTVNNVAIKSLSFANEDIFFQDLRTAAWHPYFDGSDVGITSDVDAFHFLDDGSVLMSFKPSTNVPGVGRITGEDIVRFVPTSTGENTAGTFEMYFDGSDVGLAPTVENIDAIAMDANGNLVVSIHSIFSAQGLSATDKDLIKFNASSLGDNTSGTWQLLFDGSDVGLTTSTEDIDATWISPETGDIHFGTVSTVNAEGASGFRSDLLACVPTNLGDTTACNLSLFYEGIPEGMNQGIDGLHITGMATAVEAADLSVSISDNVDPVNVGEQFTYTLSVSNAGSIPADATVLTHTLPSDVNLISASSGTHRAGVVTFNLGSIPVNGSTSVNVTVETTSAGNLNSTATASTSSNEIQLANNTANETTLVTTPQADLVLAVSDSVDPVTVGDQMTYTFAVSNSGMATAMNASLVTPLPTSLSYISSTGNGQLSAGTVTHDLGDLAPGTNVSVSITVSATATGITSVSSSVSSDTSDSNPANNADSESTNVTGPSPVRDILFTSFSGSGIVGGVPYADEDILAYDTVNDIWSMYFDGSQLGLTRADLDAFHVQDDGTILLSFNGAVTVTELGRTEDADILRFTPNGHGSQTSGTFDWYVDGSDLGLRPNVGDIDAIAFTDDGRLVISVASSQNLAGLAIRNEDFLVLNDGTFGSNTTGQLAIHLDASPLGLTNTNVDSASIETGSLYLTTNTRVNLGGVFIDGGDILRYDGNTLALEIDGEAIGVARLQTFDGIQFGSFAGNEVFSQDVIYMSHVNNSLTNGLRIADEDIVVHDTRTGVWEFFFDGSDVGITSDINAFSIQDDGSVLMSFNANTNVPDVGPVVSRDIVRFTPTSTGDTTAGSFEWYFDGSDVGLTTVTEDIDAIAFAIDGKLVVSTSGLHSVDGISGKDSDLLKFTGTSFGSETTGSWEVYFDGSDVELTTSPEDISALSIDANTGVVFYATLGNATAGGISSTRSDIVSCQPDSLGETTTCNQRLFYDGSEYGIRQGIDGIQVTNPSIAAASFQAPATLLENLSLSKQTQLVAEAAFPFQNNDMTGDVNGDGAVLAGDALRVINEISTRQFSDPTSSEMVDPNSIEIWPELYYDLNGDNRVTAIDALVVINLVAREPAVASAPTLVSLRETLNDDRPDSRTDRVIEIQVPVPVSRTFSATQGSVDDGPVSQPIDSAVHDETNDRTGNPIDAVLTILKSIRDL